ncbi:hypothetical protein QVD17_38355 [Tagetes erecta]|uniref:EGF-like domain-containing protein n=1 Tax=Tagetes erecta TaxID=13708 RepID=A0AAD8JLM2_TARER|nr:hypothetical protein QVD17_38355 [Tagetes erecta]
MMTMLLQHFTLLILVMILSSTKATEAHGFVQSLSGCSDKCGNITIPYPFGIEKGCYLEKNFQVNCTTLMLHDITFKVIDISLDGFMHGVLPMAYECYNSTHKLSGLDPIIWTRRFYVSSTMNLLTTVGCDTRADMSFNGIDYVAGSTSRTNCHMVYEGICVGHGCRQIPIPPKMSYFQIRSQRTTENVGKWSFNNCSYAFIVQRDRYTFHKTDFDDMLNRSFPAVLDWTVGHTDCKHAKEDKYNYICKENSVCIDSYSGNNGYNCRCAPGYQGNPYLQNGCQDIDECEARSLNVCIYECINTNGSYNCTCPLGKSGDGREDGSGCSYMEAAKSLRNTLYSGRKVFSYHESENDLGLAMFFVSSLERGCLIQVLDDQLKKDGMNEHINNIAMLAKACIELEGKKRPSMNAVKEELNQIRQSFINF